MSRLLIAVFSILSHLPLAVLQAVGVALGWLVYLSSPRYAARMRENLGQSGLANDAASQRRLLHQAVSATGMGALDDHCRHLGIVVDPCAGSLVARA